MQKTANPSATSDAELPSVSPPVLVGATILAVASLGVMANAAVAPALPGLRDAFVGTPHINTLAGLVISLPSLGIVLTAAAAGWLCDRVGRMRVMLASLLLYGVAGVSGLYLDSLWAILFSRFILGVAVGGTMTSSISMIGDRYQGPARTRIMSVQAAVMSGSSMLIVLLGGLLGELGWRYPFLVYAAGFAMIPVAALMLGESKPVAGTNNASKDRLDVRPLLLIGVTALLGMIFFYIIPTRLPFHLQTIGLKSPSIAGLSVAAGTLSMALMAVFYGKTGAKLPSHLVYAAIFGMTAIGFLLVATATGLTQVLIGSAISGAGYGWLFPVNNLLILKRTPASQRGRGTGFHTTCIFTGQFLSPLISGPIADRFDSAISYEVFAAAAALTALGFVAAHVAVGRQQAAS